MHKATCAVLKILFIALVTAGSAAAQPATNRSESCRKFVQDFYDWYAPTAEKNSHPAKALNVNAAKPMFQIDSADQIVFEQKPELLGSELLKALQNNRQAQAKNPTRNVSLDFDPFTGVQDFENADSYSAGPPDLVKELCSVPVYDVRDGVRSRRAVLVVRVRWTGGNWVIADVEYDNPNLCAGVDTSCNLVQILKSNEAYRATVPELVK